MSPWLLIPAGAVLAWAVWLLRRRPLAPPEPPLVCALCLELSRTEICAACAGLRQAMLGRLDDADEALGDVARLLAFLDTPATR
jgi:hypothetical protein